MPSYTGTKTMCENNGHQYSTVNNKCYRALMTGNFETKCYNGYLYCDAYFLDDFQIYPVCVKTQETIRTCPIGYSQDGNYCYKTIDAVYE